MHLNLVKDTRDHDSDDHHGGDPAIARARELTALASIVDFAVSTAETTSSHEALAYLRKVADIVKADLAEL